MIVQCRPSYRCNMTGCPDVCDRIYSGGGLDAVYSKVYYVQNKPFEIKLVGGAKTYDYRKHEKRREDENEKCHGRFTNGLPLLF